MVALPWSNLVAGQRRPYCVSVSSHSPVGLVSRQWDAVDWACVLWQSVNSHSPVGLVSRQWDAVDWACVLCDRPWTVTPPWGQSVGSEMLLTELVYCVTVREQSHSTVGLVSRQWDAVDWACELCDCRIHNDRASRVPCDRPWTVTLYRGASQSAVRRRRLSLWTVWLSHSQWPSEQIIFITTMRLLSLQRSCRLFFLAKHHITQLCQRPTAQIWLPATSVFSQS